MVDAVARLALPDEAIRDAREELRRRLRAPVPGIADRERARLTTAVARLGDMFKWGHIDEGEYRRERTQAEALLAQLPDNDKLLMFDRHRKVLLSMAENVAKASREQLQELLSKLVERVDTADQTVTRVVWTAPARPFFAVDDCVDVAPPDGLGGTRAAPLDSLAWYAA